MLIQRLEINNYRSLRSVDLDLGCVTSADDTALVGLLGRNGVGKSSILYALQVFYDIAAKVTKDDCYARDQSNPIVIRVTYGNLRPEELREFSAYIENDQLIVTKRIEVNEKGSIQKYFGAARQVPEFAELRKLGKRDRITKFKELVASGTMDGLEGTPKKADQADGLMVEYEAAHPDLLETVVREEQFFGPKEIGGGKLDKYTKFVLVPAVRNAANEEQRKGVIHELINMIVLRQVNRREDVRELRAELKEKIGDVFSAENLTELGALGASISDLLKQYAPGSSLSLTWGDPIIPAVPLPEAQASLVEDDFPCPITHAGHGLQRCLVLTLLQYLALTEPPPDEDAEAPLEVNAADAGGDEGNRDILDPDLILAIEEPELYLHPARCRYLSQLLLTLAKPPKDPNSPDLTP